ncbi:TDT family transporter [Natranaerobius trueperi]|uniref:C4-dicarboxylate ABC transporter n=1 Tax=Natranaerobius trueperi TaxID=759412 RepID=A0A226BZC9_9FIRM|nr:TDT family transporter [Natranaerobius trueperi]OWZ83549.1 C4-dicarboxylate ABC transporter [Natranaerobius trueperi]
MILQKVPSGISGLMLGLAALGNLLGTFSENMRYFLGTISGMILLILLLKLFLFPKITKEEFQNPVLGSVMATFPMGIMVLSTYLTPIFSNLAFYIWIFGLVIHSILILLFTKIHILKFDINNVFPSYFVIYVGIVIASVTAASFNLNSFGQVIFWFGFSIYLVLLPIVIYKQFITKETVEAIKPIAIIFAAPASLCLAGYFSVFPEKNILIVGFLGMLAFFNILYALIKMPKMLKLSFYPSFSAFTFPFVISAIAFNQMSNYLHGIGINIPLLEQVRIFLIFWATLMVSLVFIKYIQFFYKHLDFSTNTVKDI